MKLASSIFGRLNLSEQSDPRVDERLMEESEKSAVYAGYWGEQVGRLTKDNDLAGIERINDRKKIIDGFIEVNQHFDLDTLFLILKLYFSSQSTHFKLNNFGDLVIIGIKNINDLIDRSSGLNRSLFEDLKDISEFYCRNRRLDNEDVDEVCDKILQKLFRVRNLPVSYASINELSSLNIVRPDFATIFEINRCLISGGSINLYCCPDYSRILRPDGSIEYTFESLNGGPGLTAERSIPVLAEVIKNLAKTNSKPVTIEIGIADFEATEGNIAQVKESNRRSFEAKLGDSIRSMIELIRVSIPDGFQIKGTESYRSEEDPVGYEVITIVSPNNKVVARINLGRITAKYNGMRVWEDYTYEGAESFEELVEMEKKRLVALVDSDISFQKKIDSLLKIRAPIMIKWTDPSDRNVPETVHHLREFLQNAQDNNFESMLKTIQTLFGALNLNVPSVDLDRLNNADKKVREEYIKEIILFVAKKDPASIQYFRRKVAIQGAEYSVMHGLLGMQENRVQFAADALSMWQVFGNGDIPILAVKGGYEGADKLES